MLAFPNHKNPLDANGVKRKHGRNALLDLVLNVHSAEKTYRNESAGKADL